MKKIFLVFLLISLHVSNHATIDTLEKLEGYLQQLKSFTADFSQSIENENAQVREISSGEVYVEKPLRFHWQYRYPYEQQLIADGQTLWIYDQDLNQVIIKPVQVAIKGAPASLLSDTSALTKNYEVKHLEVIDGISWFVLTPKNTSEEFKEFYMGFSEKGLEIMEIHDNFNQITRIIFDNTTVNARIDASIFSFTPPKNADIIDERQAR
jgi:chaperone LolA